MTGLRQLSAIYVVAAGAYSTALMMSAHPDWTERAEHVAEYARVHGVATARVLDARAIRPGAYFAAKEGLAFGRYVVTAFQAQPFGISQEARIGMSHEPVRRPTRRVAVAPRGSASAPHVATAAESGAGLRSAQTDRHTDDMRVPSPATLVPQAPTPPPDNTASVGPNAVPDPVEVIRVEQRLKEGLTRELFSNFELFLYVSKANAGPWAQRMYVFRKGANDDLVLLYDWPVSTGREKIEYDSAGRPVLTDTPPGYYELDPKRFYKRYRSSEWGLSMPYAMFFNWTERGSQTGLAIHAATGDDAARLGQRASAGCIHLSRENARTLFTMIRSHYRGSAPRFAIDWRTGTMTNQGILLRGPDGLVQTAEGYKVLVFIENYGGENVVAALF